MPVFYLLLAFTILFFFITLVVLFGDLPNYRGSILHKLNILLVDKFTKNVIQKFEYFDKAFLDGYLTSHESKSNFFWAIGWIIPVFYIIIMSRCLGYFFQYTFRQIIEFEQISKSGFNWSTRYWLIILPAIFVNYLSFILAVFSDPGYIDPQLGISKMRNLSFENEFPFDNLLFSNLNECSTCKINKPARSKHCQSCDKCVIMFDHHCIWLNNDVAYYTFRWFFLFLSTICFIFLYGGYLCYYSLNLYLKYSKDVSENIKNISGIKKVWRLIKNTTFSNEISGIMLLLCICLFPLVSFFFGETLWSVYLGVTTNEVAKWDSIHDLIKEHRLFEFIPENETSKIYLVRGNTKSSSLKFYQMKNFSLFNSTIGGNLERVKGWDDLNNVYDGGFWRNLCQRLFPKKF
jgi:palmitoyltransferase